LRRFGPGDKIALLVHGHLDSGFGKLALGMLRYSEADIVAVIDSENVGADVFEKTGIKSGARIVKSPEDAAELGAVILIVGIAPPGGRIPDGWREEIERALRCGMSVVNPLHGRWETDACLVRHLHEGRWIWDVRVEPDDLSPGTGAASGLRCPRILTVGTDMSVGKMTAALELTRCLRSKGVDARFAATGQVGICIAGKGVPLDAVRLDYAPGAIEREVLREAADGAQAIVIEGQGALCHPGSTATLALMRGAMPTHLLFVARAGQERLRRNDAFPIPALPGFIALNEMLAGCLGSFPSPKTIGIALNTAHLGESDAHQAVFRLAAETGMPVADPLRHGCDGFAAKLDAQRGSGNW
jgi:uncharacterized NAD-dependent epimerase/dehydratase family protein